MAQYDGPPEVRPEILDDAAGASRRSEGRMNARVKTIIPLSLVYPPYAEALALHSECADAGDREGADKAFAQAQAIAKAFWAGVEYAERKQ